MALICRDPFDRTELHRETVTANSCDYCGNGRPKSTKLFSYWTESDAGRKFPIKGVFCSVSCMRTYHN